jgi:hypothetical protein
MERVSVINGKRPIILVAPHGYDQDDQNTDLIAETIANQIDAYAVINRGWERSDSVDYAHDKADCNNVYHCKEDVVREEFLEPIIRFKNRIIRDFDRAFIFYIHGMSNKHRKISGDPNLDIVVGYGAGSPHSFTCEDWQKNFLISNLNQAGLRTYEGKKGGAMSGWSRNNMNQYFRKWEHDPLVSSFQLEIIYELRNEKDIAALTADYLAIAFKDLAKSRSFKGQVNWGCY